MCPYNPRTRGQPGLPSNKPHKQNRNMNFLTFLVIILNKLSFYFLLKTSHFQFLEHISFCSSETKSHYIALAGLKLAVTRLGLESQRSTHTPLLAKCWDQRHTLPWQARTHFFLVILSFQPVHNYVTKQNFMPEFHLP